MTRRVDYAKIEDDLRLMKQNRKLKYKLKTRLYILESEGILRLADVARANGISRQHLGVLIRRGKVRYRKTDL